jgi:hypothetical protein
VFASAVIADRRGGGRSGRHSAAARAFPQRDCGASRRQRQRQTARKRSAGRSREGATDFSPATTAAVAVRADLWRLAATDFSWSAVYRLAEPERGGNARAASWRRRRG